MRRRLAVALGVVAALHSVASAAPYLEYLFTGSGADEAAILTTDSLPIIGGGWGCGRYNEGFPVCALTNPDQQCCAHDIKPPNLGPGGGIFDLSGQTITIGVSAIRGNADYFIEWLGVCRPSPVACVPSPSAPWCQGGLDYRNPPNLTCTLTLPGDANVQVITHWESNPSDNLRICGQQEALSGTCAVLATTSTTTTTLPFDQLPQFKKDALQSMRLEFEQALYPCLVASTGLVLIGGLGGVVIGPIIGSTLLGSAGSLCLVHLTALQFFQKIYKDPPDPAFHHFAHVRPAAAPALTLPSCNGLKGKDRATCRKLEALVKHYATAAQHVTDVATALSTTADRFSAAMAAGDTKAAKKQERFADKLDRRLHAAVHARSRSGAKLAALLRKAGVSGTLTASQTSDAVDAALAALAQAGLPEETARALLGSALMPPPVDVLATFGK
jgi:hypothetical protein